MNVSSSCFDLSFLETFWFLPCNFFWAKAYFFPVFEKTGKQLISPLPPLGGGGGGTGGEGGALLARIFTDTGRSERKVQKTFRVYLKNPISYFRAYFVHFWLVFPQYFVYNRSFLPPNLLTRTEIMNFLTVNGPTFLKIVLK